MSRDMADSRRFTILVLFLGAFLCVFFSALARYYGPDGHAAVPQPDTLLFQQYGRSMAEGHAYEFNAGDLPSTGSTSHLYSAIVALLYYSGAKGYALTSATFVFNALCYLIFLFCFWDAARRIAPKVAVLAAGLCVLCGQTVFTALGQTDMGLFMAVSWAGLAAALRGRVALCGLLLFVAAWTRPEGAILSMLMLVVALLSRRFGPRLGVEKLPPRGLALAGLAGLVGVGGVFSLNYALTGTTTFHSVMGKSPSLFYSYPEILFQFCVSLAEMLKEVLFGMGGEGRSFYALPILGGLLGLVGLASRNWRKNPTAAVEIWWLISILGAVCLVALSDWQGVQYDRYLGWALPIWFLYIAIGVRALASRFPKPEQAYGFLAGILVLYQLVGLGYFASVYSADCARMASNITFARKVDKMVEPPGSPIGVYGYGGLAYYMPNHPLLNINGITTPALTKSHFFISNLAILKHHPELRFERWLLAPTDATMGWFADLVGEQIASSSPVLGSAQMRALYLPRWDLFDYPNEPLSPEARKTVEGLEMVDHLDVGYTEDEERCSYSYYTRIKGAKIHPFMKTAEISGRTIADQGRVIYGYETFTIKCRAKKDLRIVMRTALKAKALISQPKHGLSGQDIEFSPPLKIRTFADNQAVDEISFEIPPGSENFYEVVFDLAGSHIGSDSLTLMIGGDHIVLGYWFYQE